MRYISFLTMPTRIPVNRLSCLIETPFSLIDFLVVVELPGHKAGAKLQLVKDLSTEGVGLGVGGNGLQPLGISGYRDIKLYDRIILGILIINRMAGAVCSGNDLPGQLIFLLIITLFLNKSTGCCNATSCENSAPQTRCGEHLFCCFY